jgi:hypothetical protein
VNASSSSYYGGAIYTSNGSLTVLGCTFYQNKVINTSRNSTARGGAIYQASGNLVMTGNIFWENDTIATSDTTTASAPVLYVAGGTVSSGGYNVSDKPDGTGATDSGWTFELNDKTLTGLTFDSGFRPSHASLPALSDLTDFPALYFNGDPRGTTPGAMPAQ